MITKFKLFESNDNIINMKDLYDKYNSDLNDIAEQLRQMVLHKTISVFNKMGNQQDYKYIKSIEVWRDQKLPAKMAEYYGRERMDMIIGFTKLDITDEGVKRQGFGFQEDDVITVHTNEEILKHKEKYKKFDPYDEEVWENKKGIDDPYDEEVWEFEGPKVYIREKNVCLFHFQPCSNVVYNETKDKILQDIDTLEFKDDNFFVKSERISAVFENLIRREIVWLTNGLFKSNVNYRKWKYSDLVKEFGEQNIIF